MTVTMNTATKEPMQNQFGAMNPVYGSPNTIPTICMSLYPTNVNYPTKKPIESAKATTSQLRKLIPIISGLLTFATVLSILIIFMDTSEIRLQKFRLNMTRDEELNIQRDNPELVAYIRWQLSQRKTAPLPVPSYSKRNGLVPELAMEIAKHVDMKDNGYFVQSLTNYNGEFLTGPWLAEHLNWGGLIVEPDARKYFSLCKETLMQPKVQVIQACVSPNNHPREILLREEDNDSSEVQISSLVSGNQSWFPRAKCYPLYSLMLAVNQTQIDVLSLGCQSQEIEILRTIPFDKVKIRLITIHLNGYHEADYQTYDSEFTTKLIDMTTKFLQSKSYRLEKIIDQNYIYALVDKNDISKNTVTAAAKRREYDAGI
ncbi:protein Star [Sitodiplosis mosellana]|uniref:protein Star n=1 Tax=Sitodiplosis mosellana TaxID=263140 RepID=UPI0024440F0D|nr:protein Star [Sitodiplosis mosellana]XP_055304701.1 protein Star [Sitodiplosis mosellana]